MARARGRAKLSVVGQPVYGLHHSMVVHMPFHTTVLYTSKKKKKKKKAA